MSRLFARLLILALGPVCFGSCASGPELAAESIEDRAARLTHESLLVDTHIDVPIRLHGQGDRPDDVSQRTAGGHFDWVRAREGGLDAAFMSIYVPSSYQDSGGARAFADGLIDMVEGLAARSSEKFEVARSTADVRRIAAGGRIALALGIENGAAIEDQLANLAHFHARGVRYITLTHSENNLIGDSSYAEQRRWHGLSPFGSDVVAEMNRLGILVDVSHVSDETFDAVLEATRVPPIASHSSCRSFVPGFERNLDDARIRALAEKGGVIQINFGSAFLTAQANRKQLEERRELERLLAESGLERGSPEGRALVAGQREEHPQVETSVADVADHIDHVVELCGVDHVGLGSDFDGVSALPLGLEDVSCYPNLVAELLRRGYSDGDIGKILGGNLMRVWEDAEIYAVASAGAR